MRYDVPVSFEAVLLLLSCFGAFFAGTWSYEGLVALVTPKGGVAPRASDSEATYRNSRNIHAAYWLLFCLSAVGLAMRYYDLLVIKQYFTFSSITDFKLNYDESAVGLGWVAVFSSVLAPCSLGLAVYSLYWQQHLSRWRQTLAQVMLVFFIGVFVLRGGRTGITISVVIFLSALIMARATEASSWRKSSWRKAAVVILAGCVFFLYSSVLLADRLEEMGFSAVTGLEYLEAAHHLEIEDWVFKWAEGSELLGVLSYAGISLMHYFIHGYYQFALLVESYDLSRVTWGATQFYVVFKLATVFGVTSVTAEDLSALLEEPGVYYTFFGPAYMDFGTWSFVYCFFFGCVCQWIWQGARRGLVVTKFVYPYFAAVLFHSSFVNMIQSGMGLYFLVGMFISGISVAAVMVPRHAQGNVQWGIAIADLQQVLSPGKTPQAPADRTRGAGPIGDYSS